MTRTGVLLALAQAIDAVRQLEAREVTDTAGRPLGDRLRSLGTELQAQHDAMEAGRPLDGAWLGDLIRRTAAWLPDEHMGLLARLGAVVRAAGPAR